MPTRERSVFDEEVSKLLRELLAASKVTNIGGTSAPSYTTQIIAGTGLSGGGRLTTPTVTLSVNQGYNFIWSAQHTFNAGLQIALGQQVRFATDAGLRRVGTDALGPDMGDAFKSSNFVSGISGWAINESGDGEFNNLLVRGELRASVFTYGLIAATAGSQIISKSAGKLAANMVVPASGTWLMDIENPPTGYAALFLSGEVIRIKDLTATGVLDTWFTVGAASDNGDGTQRYTCTYASGSRPATFPAGGAAIDYGTTGYGFITLSADGTIGPTANITLAKHAGSPWSSQTALMRIGNLRNAWGYPDSNKYGVAIGEYASTKANIIIDEDGKLKIRQYTTDILRFDTTGAFIDGNIQLLGSLYNSRFNLSANGLAFLLDSDTERVVQWSRSGYADYLRWEGKIVASGTNQMLLYMSSDRVDSLLQIEGRALGSGHNSAAIMKLFTDYNGNGSYINGYLYTPSAGSFIGYELNQYAFMVTERGIWVGAYASKPTANVASGNITATGTIDATTLTADNANIDIGTGHITGENYGFRATRSTNFAVPNNSTTTIVCNVEVKDSDGMHNTSTGVFIPPVAGWWLIAANVSFAQNSTGQRLLSIRLNSDGTAIAAVSENAPSASIPARMAVSTLYYLNASQAVDIRAYQDSGGDLNVLYFGDWSPIFSAVLIN